MARGTQLLEIVLMLRDEIGRARATSVNPEELLSLKSRVARVQEMYYDRYDWPFLRQRFPVIGMQEKERYYDFPDEVNVERIERVVTWEGSSPCPLDRGISFENYAIYDSQAGVCCDPPRAWDVVSTGVREQMEIWPMPASSANTVQIEGIRKLRPFVKDSDRADLDDRLLVLTLAAEILAAQENPAANAIAMAAKQRYVTLAGQQRAGGRRYRVGLGATPEQQATVVTVRAR